MRVLSNNELKEIGAGLTGVATTVIAAGGSGTLVAAVIGLPIAFGQATVASGGVTGPLNAIFKGLTYGGAAGITTGAGVGVPLAAHSYHQGN